MFFNWNNHCNGNDGCGHRDMNYGCGCGSNDVCGSCG